MTTVVFDDRDQRQATVRAQAAAIADAPRPPRRYAVSPEARLRRSPRPRRHNRRRSLPVVYKRRTSSKRRAVTVAVLLGQLGLLLLALNLPAFQVRQVTLTGEHLLQQDTLLRVAAVPAQSIFTLDSQAVRARVAALPWVQDATVSTGLPAAVHIAVVERAPALRLRRGGETWLVAGNGATHPIPASEQATWLGVPILLDDRVGAAQTMALSLIQMLSTTAQRFRPVLGCSVAAFEWDADGVLAIWASTGWRAVIGHADTGDAVAGVPAQLAALGALRNALNFARPSFGYVDLENPSAPAVGGKPGLPDEVLNARLPAES